MTSRRNLFRLMVAMVLSAFLIGPVAYSVGQLSDRGEIDLGFFGIVLVAVGFLIREVGAQAERLVLGLNHKPWLGGRLRRHQRLILPSATATILPLGLSAAFAGARYLLTAPPGWSAANVIALGFLVAGGLLQGFALTRLAVGGVIIRYSGLWRASSRAWLLGGAAVVVGSTAYAAYGVAATVQSVPAI
jgi:hypothetical protein